MDIEHLQRRLKRVTMIFRIFLFVLLIAFVVLILNRQVAFLQYLPFFASFVFAIVFVHIIKLQEMLPSKTEEQSFRQMLDNVNEAQKIINTKTHIFTRDYSAKNQLLKVDLFTIDSFLNFIQSPIVWIFCLSINGILIFNPAYLEIIKVPQLLPTLIAKVLMLGALQFLFFGLCISGIYLALTNFIQGRK